VKSPRPVGRLSCRLILESVSIDALYRHHLRVWLPFPEVCGVVRCQRITRHTTHIEAPPSVKITRPHHPLNGKELKVFGQARRKGILHLILILPDDSHAYIPVAWTDLQTEHDDAKESGPTSLTVASCHDLMRARVVVDSLLRRMSSIKTATETQKENNHGANDTVGARTTRRLGGPSGLAATRPGSQKRYSDKAIVGDSQDCKSKLQRYRKYTGGKS